MMWIPLAAGLIGMLINAIKSDTINGLLAKYALPPIPKTALPWLSLALGVGSGIIDALSGGVPWSQAILAGIMAGIAPIAGHELVARKYQK